MNEEPFKSILSGDREAMAKFTTQDFEKVIAGAKSKGWMVVGMKNDWNRVFPFEK